MIKKTQAFSSFSVDDIPAAKEFYGDTLGLNVTEKPEGLQLEIGGLKVFLYAKDDHEAASFTVLNFPVDDVEKTVDELTDLGVTFEQYEGELETDEKGIFHGGEGKGGGPDKIAWFTDPAGNIISVVDGAFEAEDKKKSSAAKV
ncbi:MAG TPA: VOC family protein [Pyrinomonadaceae bacterium]|jgi:catechol 2,3-dioxygenase-like lactoylglutathione lyase family enzyme|nr:VOC family protein [Pyrinomonadaceae bacterium]